MVENHKHSSRLQAMETNSDDAVIPSTTQAQYDSARWEKTHHLLEILDLPVTKCRVLEADSLHGGRMFLQPAPNGKPGVGMATMCRLLQPAVLPSGTREQC